MTQSINNEKVVPFLNVSNADESVAFYCEQLGFTKEWEFQRAPDAPKNVCVTLGAAKLYLSEFQESADGIKLVVWVDDISSLIEKCKATGLDADISDEGTHFGTIEVRLQDPDGNDIIFSQRPEYGP